MDSATSAFPLAGMALGLAILLIVLIVCWIVLPFAIMGTKPILRELLAATRENNRLTREISDRLGPPTRPLYTERDTRT